MMDERADAIRHALAEFENQDVKFLWPKDVEDFERYLLKRGYKIVGVEQP